MDITKAFCRYLIETSSLELTDELREQARRCLIDYLGVCVAGGHANARRTRMYLDSISMDKGSSPVFASCRQTTALHATYLNGFNAHFLELDDGHRFGMLHLASPIISALATIAVQTRCSWDIFYRSMVTGYEAAIKLARYMQPKLKIGGYHATGICGTMGAAVAVCIMLGGGMEEMVSTVGLAATSASGLLTVVDGDSEIKPHNIGKAASSGLQAAITGRLKYLPPDNILGGDRGLFKVLISRQPSGDFPTSLLCDIPEIMGIFFKPYASCRHCHPAIEGAISLSDAVEASNGIRSIDVYTYKLAIAGHDHTEVYSPASAKMSIPFCVVYALLHSGINEQSFDVDHLQDPDINRLLPLVNIHEDHEYTSHSPAIRASRIEITMENGNKLIEEVLHPKGEPENPMTTNELEEKMRSLFAYAERDGESVIMASNDQKALPADLFMMCN